MRRVLTPFALAAIVAAAISPAEALEVLPVFTDVGAANIFSDGSGPVAITTQTFNFNTVRRFQFKAGSNGGGGFTIPISNGENGRNVTAGDGPGGSSTNNDIPNPTPVGLAIAAVNNGGRIQNGNIFRFSVWIQQDPAKPVIIEPGIEPVLKFELWSEAQSTFADYAGPQISPLYGDRLWDSDVNGRNSYFDTFNPSKSSYVDINNNGTTRYGVEPAVSTPPASGEQWVLVSTEIKIDDKPDDVYGWQIAGTDYYVNDIEEIRATFYVGEFDGMAGSFANGGNFFVDNALVEVFADQAARDLAPVPPNPMPHGIEGDFNQDVVVDGADILTWQRGLPFSFTAADLPKWKAHFGEGYAEPAINTTIIAYGSPTPEPATAVLICAALVGSSRLRRNR